VTISAAAERSRLERRVPAVVNAEDGPERKREAEREDSDTETASAEAAHAQRRIVTRGIEFKAAALPQERKRAAVSGPGNMQASRLPNQR